MLRHLLLALSLVPLIIQSSVKIDAFGYNRAPQFSFIPDSHVKNTYHPYQKPATESPFRSAPYQAEHVPRNYKINYGRQAHYRLNEPRVQYVRQIITTRTPRPSKSWIRPLHSVKRTSGYYVPQLFVPEKRTGIKLTHSKMGKYQPRFSNKRIYPQLQKPLTFITEEPIPYQPTYSSIRKQSFSPHGVQGTNYYTKIRSESVTNYHVRNAAKKLTSPASPTFPLKSMVTSKYTTMVPNDNVPKHSAAFLYGKKSKTIPTMVKVVDKEHVQDAIMKPSNVKTREYLSSIPDDIASKYNAVWPYGSKDEVSNQVKDGGINELPGYSDGEKEVLTRTEP